MEIKPKNYAGVDIAKFFFCICIILIHTNTLDVLPLFYNRYLTGAVLRAAVPFFFVASGFFLAGKVDKLGSKAAVKAYGMRLFTRLIIFECLNAIFEVYFMVRKGMSVSQVLTTTVQYALFYPWGSMWFVQACILGALMLIPFFKGKRIKYALVAGLVLYAFALLCNNYYFVAEHTALQPLVDGYMRILITPRNGVFVGFLFLGLGVFLQRYHALDYFQAHRRLCAIGAVGLFLVYSAEIILLMNRTSIDDSALYITQVLLIPMLFCLIATGTRVAGSKYTLLARHLSTGVYYLQKFIIRAIYAITIAVGLNLPGIAVFAIVLPVAVIICLVSYRYKPIGQFLQ